MLLGSWAIMVGDVEVKVVAYWLPSWLVIRFSLLGHACCEYLIFDATHGSLATMSHIKN